nr:vitamin D-binding protein-like isoform X5 [Misgurnus anguillicaudatus]
MRNPALILIFVLIIPALVAEKATGKYYEKEKICKELKVFGIEKFREMVTVLYSQKFPNNKFEEVNCVVDDMTKLAEKCCKDDASPDCYDKGATEISEKSCGKNSPYPKHPGIEQCCTLQGQEKKLCLASLRYTADELPSLLEPTNEEICTQYNKEGSDYAIRYVYEFARRHRNIPAGFVLNATQTHMRMVERCCHPAAKISCFVQELTSFHKVLCNESKLDDTTEEFRKCCRKPALDTLLCVDNLKRQARQSPDLTNPLSSQLCAEDKPHGVDRYLFFIGLRHASISLPVLTTALDHIKTTVTACCSAADITACLMEKESKLNKTTTLLSKMDDTCSQYFKLDLSAFKTKIQKKEQGEGAEMRAKTWVELATSCCSQHSIPQLCQKLTQDIIKYDNDYGI